MCTDDTLLYRGGCFGEDDYISLHYMMSTGPLYLQITLIATRCTCDFHNLPLHSSQLNCSCSSGYLSTGAGVCLFYYPGQPTCCERWLEVLEVHHPPRVAGFIKSQLKAHISYLNRHHQQ